MILLLSIPLTEILAGCSPIEVENVEQKCGDGVTPFIVEGDDAYVFVISALQIEMQGAKSDIEVVRKLTEQGDRIYSGFTAQEASNKTEVKLIVNGMEVAVPFKDCGTGASITTLSGYPIIEGSLESILVSSPDSGMDFISQKEDTDVSDGSLRRVVEQRFTPQGSWARIACEIFKYPWAKPGDECGYARLRDVKETLLGE